MILPKTKVICNICTLIGSATQKKYVNVRNKNVKVEIIGRKQSMYEKIKVKNIQTYLSTSFNQLYFPCLSTQEQQISCLAQQKGMIGKKQSKKYTGRQQFHLQSCLFLQCLQQIILHINEHGKINRAFNFV